MGMGLTSGTQWQRRRAVKQRALDRHAPATGRRSLGGSPPRGPPPLKAVLKETDVDAEDDMICADKPPKEHAFVAAHQFRWLLSQEQGMVSFMNIAKNVKVTELSLHEDAILDACCHKQMMSCGTVLLRYRCCC